MLVLSRKIGEVIDISDGTIVVTILEIRDDKVRLGIAAAKDIPIHRGEVAEKIRAKINEPEDV